VASPRWVQLADARIGFSQTDASEKQTGNAGQP